MYILALNGGIEEPSFMRFDTLEELKENDCYVNKHQFIDEDYGDRVDVLKVTDKGIDLIESYTEK